MQFKRLSTKEELFILRSVHEKETQANAHLKPKGHKEKKEKEHKDDKVEHDSKPKASKEKSEKPKEKHAEKPAEKPSKPKEQKQAKGETKFPESLPAERDEVVGDPNLARSVGAQADIVRNLKDSGAPAAEVSAQVAKLQQLKEQLKVFEDKQKLINEKNIAHRRGVEDVCIRKFVFVPSYEIYGGVGGLYDFGPPGCAVLQNVLSAWRRHFVLAEEMLEISCPSMTPEIVLKTSGHVDKFTDYMVKDEKTGDCHRADKIVEEKIDTLLENAGLGKAEKQQMMSDRTQAGAMNAEQLAVVIQRYGVKAPDTGNNLTAPFAFNLMFKTEIGPTGKSIGFLRPETAQGIFVNFKRLLEYNGGKMPFASAQIGAAFRNEIAPRSGLLRVREFTLAEIEHFVNPQDKSHPKFKNIASLKANLLHRSAQDGEDISVLMSFGDAVDKGVINNETLAYFMARTWLFLVSIGIKSERLRFRQHKSTEMAHYAADCWDAEIKSSYGWIECVGHADRACYDLSVHAQRSKTEMQAQITLEKPEVIRETKVVVNRAKTGGVFKQDQPAIQRHLEALNEPQALSLKDDLSKGPVVITVEGKQFTIKPDMVSVNTEERKIAVRKFTPSVIEPSFGIGRIIYSLLEHAYYLRPGGEDDKRAVLRLPPAIAPTKVSVLPIKSGGHFDAISNRIVSELVSMGLASKVDSSSVSIGKKYARSDELGTPFAITIDFETENDSAVTVRERDSCDQVRVKVDEVAGVIGQLCQGFTTWADVFASHPQFLSHEEEQEV